MNSRIIGFIAFISLNYLFSGSLVLLMFCIPPLRGIAKQNAGKQGAGGGQAGKQQHNQQYRNRLAHAYGGHGAGCAHNGYGERDGGYQKVQGGGQCGGGKNGRKKLTATPAAG